MHALPKTPSLPTAARMMSELLGGTQRALTAQVLWLPCLPGILSVSWGASCFLGASCLFPGVSPVCFLGGILSVSGEHPVCLQFPGISPAELSLCSGSTFTQSESEIVGRSVVSKDCSSSGSSVHGILQARVLEWVAIPLSRVCVLLAL